jgi:hypothetical protein
MARCPETNKFEGLEFNDPEVDEIEVDEAGNVTASVRLERTCNGCGEIAKEATLDMESDACCDEAAKHLKTEGKHQLSVESDSVDQIEEGGGRYKKSYFGATVSFTIACSCKDKEPWTASG